MTAYAMLIMLKVEAEFCGVMAKQVANDDNGGPARAAPWKAWLLAPRKNSFRGLE